MAATRQLGAVSEPEAVFVAYAAEEPTEVSPGVLAWVRGIGRFTQGTGALLRVETRYGSLPAMLSDLDGYIARRAEEIAAPVIAAAGQSVRDAGNETAGAVQRGDDLAGELQRRIAALERQNERLRRHVAELEAPDA